MFNKEDVDPTCEDFEAQERVFRDEMKEEMGGDDKWDAHENITDEECSGMDKFHELANEFVYNLTNEQRKVLGVLVLHDKGVDALEDEIPSALHDQAHDGDAEAFKVLQADKITIEDIFDRTLQ